MRLIKARRCGRADLHARKYLNRVAARAPGRPQRGAKNPKRATGARAGADRGLRPRRVGQRIL